MEKYDKKKYRILEVLDTNFTVTEQKELRKVIPDTLNISERTFKNWLYLRKEDTTEISHINLFKISKILKTNIEQLLNFDIEFEIVEQQK